MQHTTFISGGPAAATIVCHLTTEDCSKYIAACHMHFAQLLGIFKFRRSVRSRELRDETLLDLPKVKTRMGQTMFAYARVKDWNSLPVNIRQLSTIAIFKQTLFKYLLDCDNHNHVCSFVSYTFSIKLG